MHESEWQLRQIGELQQRLLPRIIHQPAGWRVAVSYAVGPEAGGDYYNVWRLSDGRLVLVLADASGHGGLAAVMVAMVHVVLQGCPLSSGSERLPFCPFRDPLIQPPHIILGHLNNLLVENSLEDQFMTAFIGVLHLQEGCFHYASAGHAGPRWWRASRRTIETVPDVAGMPLGLFPNLSYHHKRLIIDPGDLLVLYSDGVTDAHNRHGENFGRDRLDQIICDMAPRGAEAVKKAIAANLAGFLAGQRPHDDRTVMVIERC